MSRILCLLFWHKWEIATSRVNTDSWVYHGRVCSHCHRAEMVGTSAGDVRGGGQS